MPINIPRPGFFFFPTGGIHIFSAKRRSAVAAPIINLGAGSMFCASKGGFRDQIFARSAKPDHPHREIPYQVKTRLSMVEKIADLVREQKIEGSRFLPLLDSPIAQGYQSRGRPEICRREWERLFPDRVGLNQL